MFLKMRLFPLPRRLPFSPNYAIIGDKVLGACGCPSGDKREMRGYAPGRQTGRQRGFSCSLTQRTGEHAPNGRLTG